MHFAVLTTTVIFATYAGGVLFALLAFGRWSDAIGRRPMLLAGALFAVGQRRGVPGRAIRCRCCSSAALLSGLSAGIFTGTATAAVIEAAPPNWRDRAAGGGDRRQRRRAGRRAAAGRAAGPVRTAAAAPDIHRAHRVGAAGRRRRCSSCPRPRSAPDSIGLQRLSVPAEVRGGVRHRRPSPRSPASRSPACSPRWRRRSCPTSSASTTTRWPGPSPSSIFVASAVAQIVAGRIPPQRAVVLGCAILVVGMVILAVALHFSSLPGLIAAAVVAGIGQGISFSRGLAAVAERTPPGPPRRGQLDLLRRRLRGDLTAGRRRGSGRPALGSAHGRHQFRNRGRGPGDGVPGRDRGAGEAAGQRPSGI